MFQINPVLDGYEPKFALSVFSQLLKIPRRSGQEEGVVWMVQQWAKSHGWLSTVDNSKNVVVHVPATAGYESAPVVCLQGHSDMVYVPSDEATVSTPIEVQVVDGWLQTKGQQRTLGADNGAGIALALNAAETAKKHGPIEILLTSNEEEDLSGAENWRPETHGMKSRLLINIDTPQFGKVAIMSGGFQYVEGILPFARESVASNGEYWNISLSGFLGGHSGDHIHLNRGNAIKALGVLLNLLPQGWRLVSIIGGDAGNSIPSQASATVCIPFGEFPWVTVLSEQAAAISRQCNGRVVLSCQACDSAAPMTMGSQELILRLLERLPDGVQKMNETVEGLPELSTTLAVIREAPEGLSFKSITRGSVEQSMLDLASKIQMIYQSCRCVANFGHHSPSWTQEPGSALVASALRGFEAIGVGAELKGYHCCLELASLIGVGDKKRFDAAVSIGAEVLDEHAVTERMSLESFASVANVLERILLDVAEGRV